MHRLDPCLDPIHTSGLRKFASQKDGLYEEVNKQSLSQHYIGLHQESTHKKTAKYGAFVCFKPATVRGGEFFIADAAKIARELDLDVVQRMHEKKIRISVSNLDLDFLKATGPLKEPLMDGLKNAVATLVAPKFDMDLDMIFGADGKPMRLQAVEQIASPINRHPVTGELLWFCNIHNHARYLRDRTPNPRTQTLVFFSRPFFFESARAFETTRRARAPADEKTRAPFPNLFSLSLPLCLGFL